MTANSKPKYPWYLGGLAACQAAALTHPLDVAKVRLQTSPSNSMITALFTAIKNDGIVKGAYPGLSASLLRQMTYSVTRFALYDRLKITFQDKSGQLSLPRVAGAAALAGGAGGIAGNAADIVLVRMVSDTVKPIEQRVNYRHCFDGVAKLYVEDGVAALFRGLVPNVFRAMIMNACQLGSYDMFKSMLINLKLMDDGLALHFTSSLLAGTVATTICSPADVLKSRIMSASKNETAADIIKRSFKNEGAKWLFKGWTPAWMRLGPNTIATFVILEQMRAAIDRSRAKSAATS